MIMLRLRSLNAIIGIVSIFLPSHFPLTTLYPLLHVCLDTHSYDPPEFLHNLFGLQGFSRHSLISIFNKKELSKFWK